MYQQQLTNKAEEHARNNSDQTECCFFFLHINRLKLLKDTLKNSTLPAGKNIQTWFKIKQSNAAFLKPLKYDISLKK